MELHKSLHTKNALYRWEIALMVGIACAMLAGVWLDGQQGALSGKVIRLHVIANSDSAADQTLKLAVRDRILEESALFAVPGATIDEVAETMTANLSGLADAGSETVAAAGYAYPVTATLEDNVFFPTKQYENFALPQGNYTALRVVIGEGGGKNWWCVAFPPLCLGSVTETVQEAAATGTLSDGDVALMTGEDEGYIVKFKAIEIWEGIKKLAEKR